jgi:isoleucyl-tRNA synthetase
MSSLYFDILKDRLYTSLPDSPERRSAQTALHAIGAALCRLMAPILPFTAEEIWEQIPRSPDEPESVHMSLFPGRAQDDPVARGEFRREWEALFAVREAVTHAMEEPRRADTIGKSLEAAITIRAAGERAALLKRHAAELPALFIVSKVDIEEVPGPDRLEILVERAPGTKCGRCWNVLESVGTDAELPELCSRCSGAVRALGTPAG